MKLKFEIASIEYTCKSISEFFGDGAMEEFQEYICEVYPSIILGEIKNLNSTEKENYIRNKIKEIYDKEEGILSEKVSEYQNGWDECGSEIINCFSEIFLYNTNNIMDEVKVRVGINPICPRHLDEGEFDTYYILNSKQNIANCIHEITHFIWFDCWKKVFQDYKSETFEHPNVVWIFSEIAIDPILRDDKIKKFCSLEKPAYECFYGIVIENKNMIEEMRKLYKNNSIENFMKKGIEYCNLHQDILKRYI
ncbi:hypothetical protein ACJDT4_18785 [Clostridium neuense]|uniref:Uncharacterized protein n=1 Tax=Clostridium neuense TaxID=1728934 RepID=A0ABW8TJP3_9CLOT